MLHERIMAVLADAPGGLSLETIARRTECTSDPLSAAALEATLFLSREVIREGDRWKLIVKGRSVQLLAAIDNYATASGRKIFRLAAALSGLAASDFPTEDELRDVLGASNGRFELLPNAMIKRNY